MGTQHYTVQWYCTRLGFNSQKVLCTGYVQYSTVLHVIGDKIVLSAGGCRSFDMGYSTVILYVSTGSEYIL